MRAARELNPIRGSGHLNREYGLYLHKMGEATCGSLPGVEVDKYVPYIVGVPGGGEGCNA